MTIIESFTLLGKLCCGVMLHNQISLKIAVLVDYMHNVRVVQVSLKSGRVWLRYEKNKYTK